MLALFSLAQTPYAIPVEWQTGLLGVGLWDKLRRKPPLEHSFAGKESTEKAFERVEIEISKLDERTRLEISALDLRSDKKLTVINQLAEKRSEENRDLIHDKMSAME